MSTDSRISPSLLADYLFMIEQAVKAPSGHNTQPWKFRLYSDHIDILPDFSRALPVVDPEHRELFVSLGCAAENLCIAAAHKGWLGKVSTSTDGIIHVGLSRQEGIEGPHFEQIARRQTNRRCYNGSMISDNALALLKKITVEPGIGIHLFRKGTQAFDDIAALVCEGNKRQMGNPAFKAELRQWMRYNRKHQDETADGLSYAVFGAPNLPRFMAEFIISHSLDAAKQNKTDRRNIASASHFALFTTRDNSLEHWVALGRTLQRFLLAATAADIAHAYANQPNETPELAERMAQTLGIAGEYPTILIRLGYAKASAYALRRGIEGLIVNEG